ncbi:MAG: sulfite exporter TauE/SafE family protein [Lysobacterales bacterium]
MWVVIAGALVIGLSLGLLGSGGSILTVPILTYAVGQPDKLAIAGSLAIVGSIALIGSVPYALRRDVVWRSVLWFGLPGMAATVAGSQLAAYLPGALQLTIFACVMLVAAARMLRGGAAQAAQGAATPLPQRRRYIVRDGMAVGLLTGVVGIGGGFLIVPALVLLGGLAMRQAIGTSLVVITLNAYSGFIKHALQLAALNQKLDWMVIAQFIVIGGSGAVAGNLLGARLPQQRLKQGFAVMLLLMGAFMLWREAPRLWGAS